ncbi:penicillin-binding protein 1A [Marichromatium bheemlicum]|uniref:Penicillin-binding protein 1A n=1 Tax=Marichromatium bheemlicum TaxID=365339 RepID=A0ABX1I4J5_9GAMM|nr:PBP1A family penicillin-binding protein [Marichromatium bheemlicum]NKN32465.1 PBP1A family penicillin-binding protein [Marichromatium bheemlicum]
MEHAADQQPAPEQPPSSAPRRLAPGRWLLRLSSALLGAGLQLMLLGLLGAAAFVHFTLPELPDVEQLRDVQLQEPLRVYSADGALIGEFGVQRRRPVRYRDVPALVVQAVLATEDSRFFEHRGIDLMGLARASLSYALTGEKTQGGSTISMQLTRNFFLTREKTFARKLAEVLLTLHVERTLTKQQILELYLNKIFFGHRAYGISAAAALYYDKPLEALTLPEVAMLAGIPQAPSSNNPVTDPARALERRNHVLGRMHALGYIDTPRYEQAIRTPDRARLHRRLPDLEAGHVAEMARQEIIEHYGEAALGHGYRVITTLDTRLQRAAQGAVREALHDYDRRHGYRGAEARIALAGRTEAALDALLAAHPPLGGLRAALVTAVSAGAAELYLGRGERARLDLGAVAWARPLIDENRRGRRPRRVSDVLTVGDLVRLSRAEDGNWRLDQLPAVAGALVSIDPRDGAVRALIGGYDFAASKFNRALDMRRQPGSSFKPFIYAAALAEGWTPASLVRDGPVELPRGSRWNPQNADRRALGPIRLRPALARSRNLATINLLQSVGVEDAKRYLERFGFALVDNPVGLSLALGTVELSPVSLAEGYAVFANGGYHVHPHFIRRIEDGEGHVIFEAMPPRACDDCWYRREAQASRPAAPSVAAEQVIDPRIAYQLTSMLRDVIEVGTGRRARVLGRADVVGKTGTTNDLRDSWFAGYQADFVTIAWMGFDDFSELGRGEYGGVAALGMWVEFMRQALAERPELRLAPPRGMVRVRIDPARGVELRGPGGITEWVREEYRLMLLGPDPIRATPAPVVEDSATPRVLDALF